MERRTIDVTSIDDLEEIGKELNLNTGHPKIGFGIEVPNGYLLFLRTEVLGKLKWGRCTYYLGGDRDYDLVLNRYWGKEGIIGAEFYRVGFIKREGNTSSALDEVADILDWVEHCIQGGEYAVCIH